MLAVLRHWVTITHPTLYCLLCGHDPIRWEPGIDRCRRCKAFHMDGGDWIADPDGD